MNSSPRFLPFSQRLLSRLTLLALLCMLLASLVQGVLIYNQEKRQFTQLINQLATTHVPLLQVALWDIETEVLRRQIRQIAAMPEVASVELHSATGLNLFEGERLDQRPADAVLAIEPPPGGDSTLGELRIFYQQKRLNQAIFAAVGQRFLELLIFTLLVFAVVFRVIQRDIGLPLRRIATYVSELKPQKHAPELALDRPQRHWYDEIDLVTKGFDTLREGMDHYAERHEQALAELASERDSLDQRVAERTRELAFLNGYLELVSRAVFRFMHIGHAQYPDTLRRTLEQLGRYLELDTCALLDRPFSHDWIVRLVWFDSEDWPWLERTYKACSLEAAEGWSLDTSLGDGVTLVRYHSPQRGFVFAVRCRSREPLDAVRLDLLEGTGQWLFSLLQSWDHVQELDRARQELLQLSRSDHLTGLANRRHFDQHKTEEARRMLRQGRPMALLMIDVDCFKAFNDLYGHTRGDECLVALAGQLIAHFKRAGELPARLGGEEFAILLPGYDEHQALTVADSLRRAIYALGIPHASSPFSLVSVSIGCAWWAGFSGDADIAGLMDGLAECADRALYEAKRQGRNRVVTGEYRYSATGDDPHGMHDTGNVAEQRQEDV